MRLAGVLVLVGVVVGCTPAGPPTAPTVATVVADEPTVVDGSDPAATVPSGRVTIAYPDPVATWWGRDVEDLAAGDLASLWMLPLYRVDPQGRLVPALATAHRLVDDEGQAWAVEVDLAAGRWSDGTPVTAADVVATTEVLAAARPAAWGAFSEATAVDVDTVRLAFDRPYAGWPWLLSAAPGVLPASVLSDGGLDRYDDDLPVTGGWFVLDAHEPGLRAVFRAHTDGPSGPPRLAAVEVLVVPDHDTALGLLDDRTVDVVLGHVALDPQRRRAGIEGVEGVVAFGGTRIELVVDPAADLPDDVRARLLGAVDVAPVVDGLLRDVGRPPGGLVPADLGRPRSVGTSAARSVRVQVVRTVEGIGFVARLLRAGAGEVDVELVRLDPPDHVTAPIPTDARLRLVRVVPGRSAAALLASVGMDPAVGVAADAAGTAGPDPVGRRPSDADSPSDRVVDVLVDAARWRPIAEVGVTHVWRRTSVVGVTPSGWPGLALWDVGRWTAAA